jgi:hypothetical protein
MSLNSDADFRLGDSICFEASNKPYTDFEIPPESNDFRWADSATIRIYSPTQPNFPKSIPAEDWELELEQPMNINESRVGWYWYRWQSTTEMCPGVYKVEIELSSCLPTGTPSSTSPCLTGGTETVSTASSGSSGDSGLLETVTAVSVHFFRLMPREVF